jgi:hypothetical protein
VLGHRKHTLGLNASADGAAGLAREQRVLTEVLPGSASMPHSGNIHGECQDHVLLM